jgi:hypothetical protein
MTKTHGNPPIDSVASRYQSRLERAKFSPLTARSDCDRADDGVSGSGMNLDVFLEPKVDLPRITKILDELGPTGRLATVRAWEHETMRNLYNAAKGYRALTLDDFVPPSVPPMTEVIHEGKNSLGAFTRVSKRFAREGATTGNDAAIFGYNYHDMSLWIGPGYFLVHPAETPGEVAIDYHVLPQHALEGWPEIIPNTARLGRFVYAGMVDIMRGISKHVTIGRPRRGDKWLDVWFVICRGDAG